MKLVIFFLCLGVALAHEKGAFEHIAEVNMDAGIADELFEGDIKLTSEQRGGVNNQYYRWPNARVPYVIDGSLGSSYRNTIQAAIDEYAARTCIRWYPRSNENNYVRFYYGSGCWSYIGKVGRRQDISLGYGCNYQMTVQHEMMHCMGFYHTQSRADRDSYVRIYLQNVMQDQEHNFDKVSTSVASLYGAYDLLSIMHYDCYSFSKNGNPTITSLSDPSCQTSLGQPHVGGGFRNSDIKKLNDMYC